VINPQTASVREDARPEDTAAIQSVKVKKSYSETGEMTEREVRMADKLKALELIGRHLGMFRDKVEVSGLEAEKSKLDDLITQMRGGSG
jgi:phage terminase small subunit